MRISSPRRRSGRLLLGLWGIVALLVVLLVVGAARGSARKPLPTHHRCTHGLSSVGPVVIVNGKVVAGSLKPTTETCLP